MLEFRMSSIGECSRALVAEKLGYEAIPPTFESQRIMDYSSIEEAIFADFFTEETGFICLGAGACLTCKERHPDEKERYGFHAELIHNGILLTGHIDRLVTTPDGELQMEIKSLGRFMYDKFHKEGFAIYPKYEWQEACYLNATEWKGLYLVGNRDNGLLSKYNISNNGISPNFAKFDTLTVTVTLTDIFNKIDKIADFVSKGALPEGDYEVGSNACRWCKYDFMCIKKATEAKNEVLEDRSLLELTKAYAKGRGMEKAGELMKEQAIAELVNFEHKRNPQCNKDKYQVGNYASVVYGGKKIKTWIDEKAAKDILDKETFAKIYRESKPYDDLRVYLLKEKEKENNV